MQRKDRYSIFTLTLMWMIWFHLQNLLHGERLVRNCREQLNVCLWFGNCHRSINGLYGVKWV